MKKYGLLIQFLLVTSLTVFLYGFAAHRSALKNEGGIQVEFANGENLFITYETVNKLLIQKLEADGNQQKENINLKNLEDFLNGHAMIENAEIFKTISGELGAIIR